jgi:hypothetical protein
MSTDALPQYTQVTGCDRQAPRLSEIPINALTLVTMTLAMIQVDLMFASPGIYNNMRHETGDLHCRSSLKIAFHVKLHWDFYNNLYNN